MGEAGHAELRKGKEKIDGANNASNIWPVPFIGKKCIAARNDSLLCIS